ncbi:MAG: MmgE/PrpD family protein [Pseudomonadota bacterium]
MPPDAAYWTAFAQWAAGDLAPRPIAIERAENALIDTIACILAGEATPAARAAQSLGTGMATEAFRLATSGHALELDDYDRPSVAHPSTVLVPVVLAIAGHHSVSGQRAVEAFIAGLEAMDRMGEAVNPAHYTRGWHATGTLGQLGASVTAGRLLGLRGSQMLNAMTIAASAAASLKGQFGSMGKPLHAGFAAMNGVHAALLAQGGADGRVETLVRFAELYGPELRQPLRPFGDPLAIEEFGLVVKLWPCCGYLGRIVPAALELAEQIAPGDIDQIEIEMPARNLAVAGFGWPATVDEARFSAPFCVATAWVDKAVTVGHFTEEALTRNDLRALARKIETRAAAVQNAPEDLSPADPDWLRVSLSDGSRVDHLCTTVPGSPETPVTRAQLFGKLRDAFPSSASERGQRLAELLAAPADLDDIGPLSQLLQVAR